MFSQRKENYGNELCKLLKLENKRLFLLLLKTLIQLTFQNSNEKYRNIISNVIIRNQIKEFQGRHLFMINSLYE